MAAGGSAPYGALGVALPLGEALHVEAQGDGSEYSATGSLGLRYTHRAGRLAMDGEFGLGGGVGGAICGNNPDPRAVCSEGTVVDAMGQRHSDGRDAWGRALVGGYAGVGLGGHPWRVLGFYARVRLQLSRELGVERGAPTTLWATAMGGLHAVLGPVQLFAALGWMAYFNERDQTNGALLEGGIVIPFRVR